MSSEIFYDKAFIRVADQYIPIISQGSSNCYEYNEQGRRVVERYWHVLNLNRRNKVLFSKDEIEEIAEEYESINIDDPGLLRPSRYGLFKADELKKWILSGLRRAYTVEEYEESGNHVCVINCSQEPWEVISVQTTEQLLTALKKFEGSSHVNVVFRDREVQLPFKMQTDKHILPEKYYVLRNNIGYFMRHRNGKIYFSANLMERSVRRFSNEKSAQQYIEKRKNIFQEGDWIVMCVESG